MKKQAACHPDRPMRSLGLCGPCYAKDFYKKRPEYAKVVRERTKQWRIKNAHRIKALDSEKHLQRKFGIGLADYQKMYESQSGLCKLCRRPETTRSRGSAEQRLAVDHCHISKKIRGLLCFKCNTILATIENNPGMIEAIAAYLSQCKS